MTAHNPDSLTVKQYRKMFDTYYISLCVFANKYVHDRQVSEDIVQEVFTRIWEKRVNYQSIVSLKSYLYTSVKNKSVDYLKSRVYKQTTSASEKHLEVFASEPYFYREILVEETAVLIEKAVNTLPHKCGRIIRMSLREYSNLEIADELSISINTVKAQKRIAYQKLRPILKNNLALIAYIFCS